MTDPWYKEFNPNRFLGRVNIKLLLAHNEPDEESRIGHLESACVLCSKQVGSGVKLNNGSCLCGACLDEISCIEYPEKYERRKREFLKARESYNQARLLFEDSRLSEKVAVAAGIAGAIFALLAFSATGFLLLAITSFVVAYQARRKYRDDIAAWCRRFPIPVEPKVRNFHDPLADLTDRDTAVLGVFEHWPGTPPHWEYLRALVLRRDNHQCQVTGCPSRLQLHLHHIQPKAAGGEHSPKNLVTLCKFHHALEVDAGHERIWPSVRTQYFTMVRQHERRDPYGSGSHVVRAHLRRLELITIEELRSLHETYGFACGDCEETRLKYSLIISSNTIRVFCRVCGMEWNGPRQLTEETGPLLAEVLRVTRNYGTRAARWDVLEQRTGPKSQRSVSSSGTIAQRISTLKEKRIQGHIELLREAIEDRYFVRFRYESRNGVIRMREIVPDRLIHRGKSVFVVGYCELKDGTRAFAVNRMRDLNLISYSFKSRDDL